MADAKGPRGGETGQWQRSIEFGETLLPRVLAHCKAKGYKSPGELVRALCIRELDLEDDRTIALAHAAALQHEDK